MLRVGRFYRMETRHATAGVVGGSHWLLARYGGVRHAHDGTYDYMFRVLASECGDFCDDPEIGIPKRRVDGYSYQEVPVEDLPLYVNYNPTKYFEAEFN